MIHRLQTVVLGWRYRNSRKERRIKWLKPSTLIKRPPIINIMKRTTIEKIRQQTPPGSFNLELKMIHPIKRFVIQNTLISFRPNIQEKSLGSINPCY